MVSSNGDARSENKILLIYRRGLEGGLGSFTPSSILANKTFQVQEQPLREERCRKAKEMSV